MSLSALDHASFFAAIMSALPSSILIIDEALLVLEVNRNFLEKSQGTREATIGRHLQDILPEAFQQIALDRQIRSVIRSGDTLHRQRLSYRAPGVPRRIYAYSICPLQLAGEHRAAAVIMDDVTDLLRLADEVRQTQLHLASVVESAADLIVSTDATGAIMTWNAAAEAATGFSDRETRGRLLAELIAAPENAEVGAWFGKIGRGARRRSAEWPMCCRDGRSIPVSWNLSCMSDSSGEVIGVVVVGRNLVGQREMEAQIQQAEKLAALGMVIGGIAHEIRNPLGVSSAAAQLLQRRALPPAVLDECIEKVISGIGRASAVVENLLRFARPGRIDKPVPVDVIQTLKNALRFAAGEAAAGTTIEWKLADAAGPIHAAGEQNLLELVMINLIANAFQAMPGGGRLRLAVRPRGDDIVIEIGDTGSGIAEADLPRIFDPFFTKRNDRHRCGLGLALSHSIVRQHGGSITVRSTPGSGAVFTVRLPSGAAVDG